MLEKTKNSKTIWLKIFGDKITKYLNSLGFGFSIWMIFVIYLSLIQFSTPHLPGNDGFYHIKMAYLMRTEGLVLDFIWLPMSILNPSQFYDHHFLFHVALIPFTFGDLIIGAKIASVFFASISFLCIWYMFKSQNIPYDAIWAFGLMGLSEAFIFRMLLTRTQSLSLIILLLALNWILQNKHKRLIILGVVYVWFYNAFPLLLVVAGCYFVANFVLHRKFDFKPLRYSLIGIVLGNLINPYFPENLIFTFSHIFPKIFETTSINVGGEWYPYDTVQLIQNSFLALFLFIAGSFALGLDENKMDLRTATSFGLTVVFGLMLFQSKRFIEYFPPFALIFSAFSCYPIIQKWKTEAINGVKKFFPSLLLLIIIIPTTWVTFQSSKENFQSTKSSIIYSEASEWLINNTPEGSRIFQTDWDDFPRLFFFNTHNTYLIGLDPTFLQLYDTELFDLYVDITQGKIDNPSVIIQEEFGCNFIHTDLFHNNFSKIANKDPKIKEVFRTEDSIIYQIVGD